MHKGFVGVLCYSCSSIQVLYAEEYSVWNSVLFLS